MVTLEAFASTVMHHRAGDLFNPPALTNFLGSCQAAVGVMAVNNITFPPCSHGDVPIATLILNGCCIGRSQLEVAYRWRPDRIERQTSVDGLHLSSRTVMGVDSQTVAVALQIRNPASRRRHVDLTIHAAGSVVCSRDGWQTPYSPKEKPEISVTPWTGTPPPEASTISGALRRDNS